MCVAGVGGFLGMSIVYQYAASGEIISLPIDMGFSMTTAWSGFGLFIGPLFSGNSNGFDN